MALLAIAALAAPVLAAQPGPAPQPVCTAEPGGWEHCVHPTDRDRLPRFFELLAERQGLPPINPDRLPFNRSVAVLVGVSRYQHPEDFPPLDFVRYDLRAMKAYLLGDGGFDEVFALEDQDVSASKVETMMMIRLPELMGATDRLLFYFSGHGFDYRGVTGYLAFSGARHDAYDAEAVLAVSRVNEWIRVLSARHILFLLDSCSSGLGVVTKAGAGEPSSVQVVDTLSRNGSRTVITAGTGEERAVRSPYSASSLFTSVFLKTLTSPSSGLAFSGFLTTQGVFGRVHLEVVATAGRLGWRMTPHQWDLNQDFLGSFLFLAPEKMLMSRGVVDALGARPVGTATLGPQPQNWRDLAVRYQQLPPVSAERIIVDLGVAPGGLRTVPLVVENLADDTVEISVRPEGSGLDPEFPGGNRSVRLNKQGRAELQVRLDPAQLVMGSQLSILGGGVPLVSVSFRSKPVSATEDVRVDSGPKPSGVGSSFSPAYELCANAPGADFELDEGSDRFYLTGDRECGAWAECKRTVSTARRVCWAFRMQGHDELVFNSGVRESEGHLVTTFRRKPSEIQLTAGS